MIPSQTFGSPVPASSVNVAYTGTAGVTAVVNPITSPGSLALSAIRVLVTSDAFVEITAAGTAATAATGMYMFAGIPEYFSIPPNGKVSAIQVSAAGTLYVTPMA